MGREEKKLSPLAENTDGVEPPDRAVVGSVGSTVVRVDWDDRMSRPEKLDGPEAFYSEDALTRGLRGSLVLRCVVTVDGRVHDCRVLKSLPFMDRAVLEALEMQHYRPATLNGNAVEVNYDFLVIPKVPSNKQPGAENVTSVPAAVE